MLLLGLDRELGLYQCSRTVRVPDVAVRCIRFQHDPIQGNMLQDLKVICGFHAAAIDPNIKPELKNLLELIKSSRETVNNSSAEGLTMLPHEIVEVVACISIVQVKWQLVLLC